MASPSHDARRQDSLLDRTSARLETAPAPSGAPRLCADEAGRSESIEELRAKVAQLKCHAAELVDQLGLARQQLTRVLELQEQSAALLSFDLRTQTTTIAGAAELLATELPGPLTKKQSQLVENVSMASMRLYSTVNSLIEYNRLQVGPVALQLSSVNVEAVCRTALEHVSRAAADKQQRVHFACRACGPEISADAQRLEQMIEQLLNFAVQRAPIGGNVALEVALDVTSDTSDTGAQVTLCVRNNGPAINAGDLGRLFEPFDSNGTRLSLVLARELAHLQGGLLRVASRPGQGSTCVVTLPVQH
jgi:signal transduction histidine kinase